MPTEEARTAMRNYLVGDYQKSVYADDETYTGPNLYMVHGYDISSNVAVKSELYIPEIDVRLEAYRKIIPELSEDYITVIYSGTKEEMNYKSGFLLEINHLSLVSSVIPIKESLLQKFSTFWTKVL